METFAYLRNSELYKNGQLRLIIAGGYNDLVVENIEYLKELEKKAKELDIQEKVEFLRSISTEDRDMLLQEALCLLYTPPNEHFGIVPLEAGLLGTPVIACNSGGPCETVVDGETGFLREPKPDEWGKAVLQLVNDLNKAREMGQNGKKHVNKHFSKETFINRLIDIFHETLNLTQVKQKGKRL